MKNLIVLSGNIGVGLTTYGELLANESGYDWFPEDPFISTFERIYKSTERDYCLLSLIENAVRKTTLINEQFLKGKETLIIERFVLDELIRFRALMDLYSLEKYMNLYDNLISLLDNICCDIKVEHLLIKIDLETLKKRNENRPERFKYVVHDKIVKMIDDLYESPLLYNDTVIHKIYPENRNDKEVVEELLDYIKSFMEPICYNSRKLSQQDVTDPTYKIVL